MKTSYEPTAVSTLTTNERQKIPQRPLPIIRMTNVLAIPTTQSVTPSPTILPAAINRDCITPSFSEYARNARSKMQLPTPSAGRQSHFRFNAPMQVEGGLRINTIYPYGYDAGEDAGLLIHVGMDAMGGLGTPILAAASGTVVYARSDKNELHGWRCNWYGQFVSILHDEEWQEQPVYTLYGHVQNMNVVEGEHVEKGQKIAEVGVGGAALAPHLHVEVRVGENRFGTTRNPAMWIRPVSGYGAVVGRLIDENGYAWQGVKIDAISNPREDNFRTRSTTWSYLGDENQLAQSDEQYGENFVFGNLERGIHTLYVEIDDLIYQQSVVVSAGEISEVELMTGGDRGATKTPVPTYRPPPSLSEVLSQSTPTVETPPPVATGISPASWSATATAATWNK